MWLFGDAAEDHADFEAEAFAISFEAFGNLHCQLTSGGEDQAAHAATEGLAWIAGKAVQHGQRKGCGLTGAGLCAGEQVVTFEQDRDGFGLNGRGRGVALCFESSLDRIRQSKILKCNFGHSYVCAI